MGTSVSPWPAVFSAAVAGRGLHSSSFRLNVSGFFGIGVEFKGYLEGVDGVLGGITGCLGCSLCQKRLRLS